eukprot:superscaffoldBa00006314_g21385
MDVKSNSGGVPAPSEQRVKAAFHRRAPIFLASPVRSDTEQQDQSEHFSSKLGPNLPGAADESELTPRKNRANSRKKGTGSKIIKHKHVTRMLK